MVRIFQGSILRPITRRDKRKDFYHLKLAFFGGRIVSAGNSFMKKLRKCTTGSRWFCVLMFSLCTFLRRN